MECDDHCDAEKEDLHPEERNEEDGRCGDAQPDHEYGDELYPSGDAGAVDISSDNGTQSGMEEEPVMKTFRRSGKAGQRQKEKWGRRHQRHEDADDTESGEEKTAKE